MSAAEKIEIPFELKSLSAAQVAELLGYSKTYVRDNLSVRPDFPRRADNDGHPRWVAKDILEWRDAIQAGRLGHRRRLRNRS